MHFRTNNLILEQLIRFNAEKSSYSRRLSSIKTAGVWVWHISRDFVRNNACVYAI